MPIYFKTVMLKSDEIHEKLKRLADFAKTLDFAIKSHFSIDFESDMVQEVHVDIVPVEFYKVEDKDGKDV